MGRFRRILYVERRARGSRRAFACALGLASEHGASLTLAVPARGGVAGVAGRGRSRVDTRRVAPFLDRCRASEVPVRVRPLRAGSVGRGPGGIGRVVRGHDLVVTVARPRGSVWPVGSRGPERRLVRECGCPVWLLHPAQSAEVRVVVAAVDVADPADDVGNLAILRSAAALAGAGELHVVHCWSVVAESLLASRSRGGSPRGAERVAARVARARRRRVQALLAGAGVEGYVILHKGDVVRGIEAAVWSTEADVVVLGSAGRTGLAALLFGNTPERLIGRVPASVFVVRSPASEGAGSRELEQRAPWVAGTRPDTAARIAARVQGS